MGKILKAIGHIVLPQNPKSKIQNPKSSESISGRLASIF
jgi:hypothetical protein